MYHMLWFVNIGYNHTMEGLDTLLHTRFSLVAKLYKKVIDHFHLLHEKELLYPLGKLVYSGQYVCQYYILTKTLHQVT